jgi:predicted amidohydrolase
MTNLLQVALGEYDTGWHDPEVSLSRAALVVARAAAAGAQLVVLPEMCTTGFTMDPSQAESLDGPSVHALGNLAAAAGVHLLAGVAVREMADGG